MAWWGLLGPSGRDVGEGLEGLPGTGEQGKKLKNRPKVFLGQPERGASSMPTATGMTGILGRRKKTLDKL